MASSAAAAIDRRGGIMKTISILIPMHLAGQAKRPANQQTGYAMAALLVAMSDHGHHVHRRDARLEAGRDAREGRGAGLSRQAVRSRDRPVPAQVRERLSAQHRRARRAAVPSQEVQGSDHRRRLRADSSGTRRARHSAAGWSARRVRRTGGSRTDAESADAGSVPTRPRGRTRSQYDGARSGRCSGRHQWRDQQEQSSIDSPLQRTRPLQRVGLCLHSTAAGSRRRRRPRFGVRQDAAVNADSPANPPVPFQAAISLVSADAVPSVPTDPDAATAAWERLAAAVSHRSSPPRHAAGSEL